MSFLSLVVSVLRSFLLLSQVYGDIEYCSIIKNKVTGESKGLGYVRYLKPSQAAQAIENCDKSKNDFFKSFILCVQL